MTLILTPEQDADIREHASKDYPGECCGVLIGYAAGAANYSEITIKLANIHEDGPDRRFRIDPADLMRAEKIARSRRQNVIGFYHSHPDCQAVPSEYDREHAWEEYSYLILEVREGTPSPARSWRLRPGGTGFQEENLLVNRCILESAARSGVNEASNETTQ